MTVTVVAATPYRVQLGPSERGKGRLISLCAL